MNPLAVVIILVALLLIITGVQNKQAKLVSAVRGKDTTF